MSKLVRDGVEESLAGRTARVVFRSAPESERRWLLFSKLLEEAGEWLLSGSNAERIRELGDIQEVIWALGEVDGIEQAEIIIQASEKRRERGSFSELAIMCIEIDDEHDEHGHAR